MNKKVRFIAPLLLLMGLFADVEPASAVTVSKAIRPDGEELVFLNTTDGLMAFGKSVVGYIDSLKRRTVIVYLQEPDGSQRRGAGFIKDKRHILTVNHVAADVGSKGYNFYYENEHVQPYLADVTRIDAKHDVALLEIDKNAPDLPVSEPLFFSDPTADAIVYTVGHPLAGLYSVTQGRTSNASGRLQITVQSGNSGGFVINQEGKIVGMITSKQEQVGDLAYMTPSTFIQALLE